MMALPHSVSAEQALLGMLLEDNRQFDTVSALISPDDFYVPVYRNSFVAIGAVIGAGLEANPISLVGKLKELGECPSDIQEQLARMMESAGLAKSAATMAWVVADYARKRRVIALAQSLADAANNHRETDIARLQRELAEVHASASMIKLQTPEQQAQAAFKMASEGCSLIPTGFKAWDEALGGIFPGSRYIIAGAGGSGKSALAINIAWNWAKSGKRVRWLSYEEKPEALWWRIMARETLTPYISFRKGLTENQKKNVSERGNGVGNYDFVAMFAVPTVPQMIAACGPCDLIVLDGMTTAPAPGGKSMVDNAGIVTRYCAELAEKTGAAVLILAHINSDAVKNGADMAGIYGGQAATFDPEGIVELRRADPDDKSSGPKEIALKIIKARYGEAGVTKRLMFNGNNMMFYEVGAAYYGDN